jgi:prepilin-type N-terminal cleavage/methylation domain-containing protein
MHPGTVGCPPRRTPLSLSSAFHANAVQRPRRAHAFTLIELLVVIAIIAVLIGFFVPTLFGIFERAKKVQAKNDLTQIVNAVNGFYTEYGKYPTTQTSDYIYGATTVNVTTTGPANTTNDFLFNELRSCTATQPSCPNPASLNTRQIVYISPRVLGTAPARSGIGSDGQFYDPWQTPYNVEIDGDYTNNITANPYGNDNGAGPSPLPQGVISWSLGKDRALGTAGTSTSFTNSDDVISWQ